MISDRSKCWCWRTLVLGAKAVKETEETKELPRALMTCQYYNIIYTFIDCFDLYILLIQCIAIYIYES